MYTCKSALNFADEASASAATAAAAAAAVANIAADIVLDVSRLDVSSSSALRGFRSCSCSCCFCSINWSCSCLMSAFCFSVVLSRRRLRPPSRSLEVRSQFAIHFLMRRSSVSLNPSLVRIASESNKNYTITTRTVLLFHMKPYWLVLVTC